MLASLQIKNIAIIDELSVNFENGFNVLTGETGAGKSILIDSINMVLGERTSRDLIRFGEQKAYAAALFYLNSPAVISALGELGITPDADNSILISREINADGRNICKINNNIVNTALVREASRHLIDLHGQNDSQALLTKAKHIDFLDNFSGAALGEIKAQYLAKFMQMKAIKSQIEAMHIDEAQKQARLDLLSFQQDEIKSANLSIGEDEILATNLSKYKNMQRIIEGVTNAYALIKQGEGYTNPAIDNLNAALFSLSKITQYSDELLGFSDRLAEISVNLEEFARDFKPYIDSLGMDEQDLLNTEARLDLLFRLKRKYGEKIEDILNFYETISEEYNAICLMDETLADLKNQHEIILSELEAIAKKLSEIRKENAKTLSHLITTELKSLNMAEAIFMVSITAADDFRQNGIDDVEFLITTNVGEPLKPLIKIASGGELARIMLSIKSIISSSDVVDTMIFDEIDTGVSGDTANKISQLIAKISKTKQVLCITHLAQIAAMADFHYLISKRTTQNKTITTIEALSQEQRAEQLSKITGLSEVSVASLIHAKELLAEAQKQKNSMR